MSDKKRSKSKKGGKQSASSSSSSSSASAPALFPLAQRLARCSRSVLEDALLETLGGVSGAEIDRILGEEVNSVPPQPRFTFLLAPPANASPLLPTRCLAVSYKSHAPHTRPHTRPHTTPCR